jgi:hypothetical protein
MRQPILEELLSSPLSLLKFGAKNFFFYNPIILARPYRTLVGMAWAEVTITDRGFARTPNPGLPRLQPSKLFWNPASGACALRTEPPEMMIKRSCCARRVLQ